MRDREIVRVERAHEHDRPFDEARHLLEQGLVLDELEPRREAEVPRLMRDDVAPARRVEHHLRLFEARRVIREPAHPDRTFRTHDSMAEGTSPEAMPPISKCTTSGSSVSGPKVHRIVRKGRTQRSESGARDRGPKRIDFGQGKLATTDGTISAMTAIVGSPGLSMRAA